MDTKSGSYVKSTVSDNYVDEGNFVRYEREVKIGGNNKTLVETLAYEL